MAIDIGSEYARFFVAGTGLVESRSCDPWTGKAVVAHGVIVDEDAVGRLVQRMLTRAGQPLSARGRVLASCPLDIDCAETRLRQAMRLAGARDVEVVRSTVAAAAGAGLDVTSRFAGMLVDVGAGLTEVAVFRNADVLHARTIPVGARDLETSPPRTLSSHERRPIPAGMLADLVASVWKGLPERVQVEVIETGLVLSGGGAEIPSVIAAMEQATRLTVRVAERPGRAVIRGLARLGSGPMAA